MKTQRFGVLLWTAAALAIGLALRLWFIAHSARIAGDTFVYGEIARNWMQHGVYGFVETKGLPEPTLIRLPGYPLFLIACYRLFGVEQYTAVMYVQTGIDLLSCLLVAALTRRLFGGRVAMAALWLAVLCPFTASYVAAPLTETLTLCGIVVTFYAFERWREAAHGFTVWLWVLVLAIAYSILLRPEQGLLLASVIPAMLWIALRQPGQLSGPVRKVAPILIAAVCMLLPLLPWTIRNYRTFHVVQPLAPRYATDPGEFVPLGFQRWYRTWAIDFASTEDVYWNYNGALIQISDLPTRAFDSDDQYIRTDALLTEYNETSNATPALDARFSALAKERIGNDPLRYYLALPFARLVDMALRPRAEMFPTPLEWWKYREHPGQTIFAALYASLNLAYFILAGLGIRVWYRRQEHRVIGCAMLASILLRSTLLLTLDNSEPRYTLEFFPILFIFASLVFTKREI